MREQARAMLGPMLSIGGRWDEARRLLDELLEGYAASGGHYLEGGFLSGRAMLRAACGEASGAAADADRAMALARVANDPQAVVPVFGRSLRAYVALGRIREATRIADEVIDTW